MCTWSNRKQAHFFGKIKGIEENFQVLPVVFKAKFQIHGKTPSATLTTTNMQLISDLLADLGWGNILFSIKGVHNFQLLFCNQLSDNFYAVPFWQPTDSTVGYSKSALANTIF